MEMCYITFRSVTYAQRGEAVLKRKGYKCSLLRAPKWMGQRSCAYALQVRRWQLPDCVAALREGAVEFSKVFCYGEDGRGEEIVL